MSQRAVCVLLSSQRLSPTLKNNVIVFHCFHYALILISQHCKSFFSLSLNIILVFISKFFFSFFKNWNTVDLQCCVSFRYMAQWFRHIYVVCLDAQSSPTLCNPMDCRPPGSSVYGDSPGKNTGVGCHFLLHLPDPGIKPRSPTLHVDLLPAEPQGKP